MVFDEDYFDYMPIKKPILSLNVASNADSLYPYYVLRREYGHGAPVERLQKTSSYLTNLHTLLRSVSNMYLQTSCFTCRSFIDPNTVLNLFHDPRATETKGGAATRLVTGGAYY